VTYYVWEGSQVIGEHSGTGGVIANYVYAGGRMISRLASGVVRYYLNDRLSVRMMLDNSGSVAGRQGHLPFGEEIGTSGEMDKKRFTSYERDSESGLDYAVNREYTSAVGRFLQADPYRASGGATEPQSWNRYAYVHNNPTNAVDRMGLDLDYTECYVTVVFRLFAASEGSYWAPVTLTMCADASLGEKGPSQGGGGTSRRDTGKTWRRVVEGFTRFFQEHPNCESTINIASLQTGQSLSLSDILEGTEYVSTTGDTETLGKTLGQLGFDFLPSNEQSVTLSKAFEQLNAITNGKTRKIYFAPGFFKGPSYAQIDQTIVHELLHVMFYQNEQAFGQHWQVANALGLRKPDGSEYSNSKADEDLADAAIEGWLGAGCP
jgi:RHS repeat-associated protein